MTIKCLVILYFLTCSYIYGTSVDQERMSSCYSYGKCYNHVWCDNVLSSRNCSEKHLVRKLECLSALFADWSNESQWSDTINSLKDNVTMTMKQVHDFKEEIVDIKSDCSKTTTELNARRQQNEKNTEEIKKLDLSCTNIRNNLNNINHSMLQLREQGDKTGKTIETMIDILKDNVTMMMKHVHDLREEMVVIKNDSSETTTELNAQRQQNEKFTGEIKKIAADSTNLKNKLHNINAMMSQLEQQGDNAGKTIEKLTADLTSLNNLFMSFKSDTLTKHTTTEKLISSVAKEVKEDISNSEAKFKDLLAKETEKTNKTINALEQRVVANQEQLYGKINSFNDTVSVSDRKFNETLKELKKEMHDSFENIELERKRLEVEIKDIKAETKREIQEKTETLKLQMAFNIDSQSDMIYSLTNNVTMMMKQVHDLNEEMVVIKSTCSDTRTDFKVIKAETEREMKEKYENVKQKLTDDIGKTIEKMTSKIYADIEELLKRLDKSAKSHENELISETGKFQVKIEDYMKKINTELEALKTKVKTSLEMSLQETKYNIEGLRTEIKTLIITEIETLSKQIFEVNQSVLQQQKLVEVICPNTFNKEMFIIAFIVLVVMVAINIGLVYTRTSSLQAGNLNNAAPELTERLMPANQHIKNMGANEILRRLPRNPNLEPGICVISYDENRTNDHRKLLDSVNIPKCNVISHVIRRHEQILDLPRCTVYLMCTEFSERHVIIEEPGLGLGDFHRTTYGAVMKLGGSLIILYTKDPGSRHLKNDALYNTKIYCATKQPELSDLEKNGCFVSTYDVLTDYQKTELRKKIVENIN